ncbi:uncharacterized protein TRAVEDRAFT_70876 [Trametes versicolor FP-101664 SS1]|uniref:uncharacterized protein n=1 Tax=Trametes versicolor (strain FP-101664) TaxID=717944 RepID=UPI00046249F6|nr:uncharacterized protein TRAVEDRAFT_70876 [Trametes versicolor FP-101664 SS1]EIW60515.1 hypothetical protein TRAVEDRAFT_70876 [Trametes versicolor FP-101664 SS1]
MHARDRHCSLLPGDAWNSCPPALSGQFFSHCFHSGPALMPESGRVASRMSTDNHPNHDPDIDWHIPSTGLHCGILLGNNCINGPTLSTATSASGAALQTPGNSDGQPPDTSPDPSNTLASATPTSSVVAATSSLQPTSSPITSFYKTPTAGDSTSSTKETSVSSNDSLGISSAILYTESTSQTAPDDRVSASHTLSTDVTQAIPSLLGGFTTPPVSQVGPPSISPASGAVASSNKHSNHTGAIVGGVIGGLAFLLLVALATILIYRRMRARRTAPSAEFTEIMRGTTPGPMPAPGTMRTEGTTTPSGDRLLGLGDDDDERPPAFVLGEYGDPVLEKV